MAPSIISNDAVQGEVFLPGQIFVFGGFALRANSLGHLEQIDSYAPGHQISFGNLDYVADIRGDLIFQGFTTPTSALALDPEHTAASKDWRLNPTTEATDSTALEPHIDLISHDTCATRTTDSSPAVSSEPCEPADAELDRLSIFEFSAADIFQHSPLGDVLNSLKNLSLAEDSQPNYIRLELGVTVENFASHPPPTS